MAQQSEKRVPRHKQPVSQFALDKNKGKKVDRLTAKVLAAEAAGYGCHYGQFVADHPHAFDDWDENKAPVVPLKKIERVCECCGKIFIIEGGRGKTGRRYCSDKCQKEINRRQALERYHRNNAKEAANNGNN